MDIVINLDTIVALLALPPDVLLARFFLYVGWIPFAWFLLWAAFMLWIDYVQTIYADKREFILLALDVPVGNEQTPVAIEKLFAHLAGAHGSINLLEKYWEGVTQDRFSLEIVSIDGYTQYLIYTMPKYRDLIEAAIYAEYPEAEIAEVDDYTNEMPDSFPDDTYDLWGAEFILAKNSYYPIRSYKEFEHQLSGDFKDPFAALMELFSGLRKGEQCWYQIILTPVGQEFPKGADDEINKVIGFKPKSSGDIVDKAIGPILKVLSGIADFIIPSGAEVKSEDDPKVDMLNLKPLQKKAIEAIQMKVSKLVFEVKIRFVYVAEKEVMSKARVSSFVGFMKQFNVEDLNSFKPDTNVTQTKGSYFFKAQQLHTKQKRIMSAYKSRSNWSGRLGFLLNIEELATIWHFPIELAVKAPMLQRVSSRKSEAPSYLPVVEAMTAQASRLELQADLGVGSGRIVPAAVSEAPSSEEFTQDILSTLQNPSSALARQSGPPANLPIG